MLLSGEQIRERGLISDAASTHYRASSYDLSVGEVVPSLPDDRTEGADNGSTGSHYDRDDGTTPTTGHFSKLHCSGSRSSTHTLHSRAFAVHSSVARIVVNARQTAIRSAAPAQGVPMAPPLRNGRSRSAHNSPTEVFGGRGRKMRERLAWASDKRKHLRAAGPLAEKASPEVGHGRRSYA